MKYKGVEIGVPTIKQIKEYIARKNFNVVAEDIYNHYKYDHHTDTPDVPHSWSSFHRSADNH